MQKNSEFDRTLIVIDKESNTPIGECKLGLLGEEGVAHTDVKLLPALWGKGFGLEIKQGLVDYLFTHTSCKAIQASPNRSNICFTENAGKSWRKAYQRRNVSLS